MKKITFYTKKNCLLCDEAYELLQVIKEIEPFEIDIKDIYEDDVLLEKYQVIIPVVQIKTEELFGDAINFSNILNKMK